MTKTDGSLVLQLGGFGSTVENLALSISFVKNPDESVIVCRIISYLKSCILLTLRGKRSSAEYLFPLNVNNMQLFKYEMIRHTITDSSGFLTNEIERAKFSTVDPKPPS